MFYYQITTTRTRESRIKGQSKTTRTVEYREFLRARDVGDCVTDRLIKSQPRSVVVKPINQATFIRRTRGAE